MTLPIRVLGTGGTISCTHDAAGMLVPTLTTAQLVDQAGLTKTTIATEDILSLDSSSITLAQIDNLLDHIEAAQRTSRAVVVLHGTDTMEETLMAAHLLLPHGVPVVFTGAQRPADDPHPDGPDNLAAAIAHASDAADSGIGGIHLHFGGRALPAVGTYKFHTTDDDAFRSTHADAATDPAEYAPRSTNGPRPRLAGKRVPIIATFAGDDGQLLRALHNDLHTRPVDGLVIAGLGSGNLPLPVADALLTLVDTHPKLPVTLCTRVPEGEVQAVYGGAGGGASLLGHSGENLDLAGALTPAQARMRLLARVASGTVHAAPPTP